MKTRIVRRVLVVDDMAQELEAARMWMPDREVLVEPDNSKVLERVRQEQPDLVILDLWYPDRRENGGTIATALKAEDATRAVVVISAGLTARAAYYLARRCAADLVLPKEGRRTFDEILSYFDHGVEPDPWGEEEASIADIRRDFARRMLAQSGGNKAEAARRAGVSWITLHRWSKAG